MVSKVATIIILIALAWGLTEVVVSPLETGAVYPEYSSLRSDPMGSLALYESFGKILKVERLFKSRRQVDAGAGTTFFVLGVDPVAWAKLKEETLEEYAELTSHGARLVIAFLPVSHPIDQEAGWHIHFANSGLRGGPEWKTLDRNANALERKLGAGSVVLVGNSYPLSNEGLRDQHDAALLVKLAGPAKEIVFDENHFGVMETGSVTKLMRKYHLEGALAVLALVAALFLWRSASSLLPSRAPRSDQPVTGRDSLEGMTALLRRGIAEKDLLRVCYKEWEKTSLNDDKVHNIALYEALLDHKSVVAGYKALMEKL
jgi:hypothetical protein